MMFTSTPNVICNLALSQREESYRSQNLLDYCVYLSRLFLGTKNVSVMQQTTAIIILPQICIQVVSSTLYFLNDNSDNSVTNHNVDSDNILRHIKA